MWNLTGKAKDLHQVSSVAYCETTHQSPQDPTPQTVSISFTFPGHGSPPLVHIIGPFPLHSGFFTLDMKEGFRFSPSIHRNSYFGCAGSQVIAEVWGQASTAGTQRTLSATQRFWPMFFPQSWGLAGMVWVSDLQYKGVPIGFCSFDDFWPVADWSTTKIRTTEMIRWKGWMFCNVLENR